MLSGVQFERPMFSSRLREADDDGDDDHDANTTFAYQSEK